MFGIGKMLVTFGLLMVLSGLFFMLAGKIPFLGKLPGDIVIKKENFTFYFPLVTFLLISIILTVIINIILRLINK
jgi:uncharacterized protein HemY